MMNEEGEDIRAKRPHFDSLGELMRAHEKLFDSEPACSYLGKKLLLEEAERTMAISHYRTSFCKPQHWIGRVYFEGARE
jgi:hypothetical protein